MGDWRKARRLELTVSCGKHGISVANGPMGLDKDRVETVWRLQTVCQGKGTDTRLNDHLLAVVVKFYLPVQVLYCHELSSLPCHGTRALNRQACEIPAHIPILGCLL
jgi:hypothetical protein